jgi:hypothetical protein
MTDRHGALAFLQRYTDGSRESALALVGRHRVVIQVDPAECDWDTCSGWHMELRYPEDDDLPLGIPVDDLVADWQPAERS